MYNLVNPGKAGSSTLSAPVRETFSALVAHSGLFQVTGIALTAAITFIGIRMLAYWASFWLRPNRYRSRAPVSTAQLRRMPVPFIKVQWTTKGSPGSSEVILRGLRQLEELAAENPDFYRQFLSAEIVTENEEQAELLRKAFADSPLAPPDVVVTPRFYRTPNGTQLKAKQLHYLVEKRRAGWNLKPGKTFIVHFDEDTLMVPGEFRKMIAHLAYTGKKILTGPIYYPLEYGEASQLARATEASRPITCFECRRVMETGVPLHVHGSNLVIEEELENRLGWDFGLIDSPPHRYNIAWQVARRLFPAAMTGGPVPYVAEDYMFGMDAFLKEGREAFGWHGCVALEQPPFSFRSVFRQRYRWIFGVLQGMSVDTKLPLFKTLSWRLRMKVVWGTRYRISTFALGTLVGAVSMLYIPFALIVAIPDVEAAKTTGIPWELTCWFALIGTMWLGSSVIGAWVNVRDAGYTTLRRIYEISKAVCIAPVAGMMENLSGLQAVYDWMRGKRSVEWKTTPSTKAADLTVNGKAAEAARPLAETVSESPVPWHKVPETAHISLAAITLAAAAAVVCMYIGFPFIVAVQSAVNPLPFWVTLAAAGLSILLPLAAILMVIQWTARPARHQPEHRIVPQVAYPEGWAPGGIDVLREIMDDDTDVALVPVE